MRIIKNTINAYIDRHRHCPYERWLSSIKDAKTRAAIISRIDRMELGIFGDVEPVGEGISELRMHCGPGYRVYYAQEGRHIYFIFVIVWWG